MQDIQATSIMSLFETNKEQRKTFVESVMESIISGERNPLEIHLQLKAMEDIIKQMTSREDYKAALLEEAEKNGKSFQFHQTKMEVREVGTKYDYSGCQDSAYNDMMQQKIELDAKMKAREKMLQSIPESGMVNPDTGEMIYRAAKSSTTSVVVTLK